VNQRDYRILIGAAGWQHKEWENEVFYPEDLPDDWYLSFYANEFPVVLLSFDCWQDDNVGQQMLDEISEQASDGFRCLFECSWNQDNSEQLLIQIKKLDQVSGHVAGLLITTKIENLNNVLFTSFLALVQQTYKVCLALQHQRLNDDVSEDELTAEQKNKLAFANISDFCHQHNIALCWDGKDKIIVPDNATLWVARCNSERDKKTLLLDLKTIIAGQLEHESLLRDNILIVDGSPPGIDALRNATIMLDIM